VVGAVRVGAGFDLVAARFHDLRAIAGSEAGRDEGGRFGGEAFAYRVRE
jgi:hypothetical protein